MQQQLRARLDQLRAELEKGQAELDKVESQRAYLRETMLRIAGAIQVLEELLPTAELAGDGSSPRRQTGQGDTPIDVDVGSGSHSQSAVDGPRRPPGNPSTVPVA